MLKTSSGHELRYMKSGRFTMGASRREQGRRANETLRPIVLTRAFYIGVKEVTNREFRQFKPGYSSDQIRGFDLNQDDQPVVRISWQEAAAYCNWLSERESLPPAYVKEGDKLVAADPMTTGYRLPTEAEWAWAARFAGNAKSLKYPWGGSYPPTGKVGNYADTSASHLLANHLQAYEDGFPVSSPVGSFQPNGLGLYDLGGNVAEWSHDYYAIHPRSNREAVMDPLGPADGKHHVIRGSSWRHASISELRLSYRDYSDQGRPDLGFRIARYAD
jgi:formylglycine-generating enzyme required for sulfatase activity